MSIYSYDEDRIVGERWSLSPLFTVDQREKIRMWHITFNKNLLEVRTGIIANRESINDSFDKVLGIDVIKALTEGLFLKEDYPLLHKTYNDLTRTQVDIKPKAKRDMLAQAILETKSRWKKKKDSGYTHDLHGLIGGTADVGFKFQLANTYKFPEETDHKATAITQENLLIGISCQIKEDGDRCGCRKEGVSLLMFSRKNLPYRHLERQREQILSLMKYLPENTHIDGELTHSDGLEAVRSILAREERHEKMDEVIYHIFDIHISTNETLEKRIDILNNAFSQYKKDPEHCKGYVTRIKNHIFHSLEDMREFYQNVITAGKEGIVVRKIAGESQRFHKDSLYLGGRNNNLLKIKPFADAEATIVDVLEGKGTNKGCAIFVLEMENGKRFKCKPHGTIINLRRFFQERDTLIGRSYTYKFNGFTNKGTPSKATGLAFRD